MPALNMSTPRLFRTYTVRENQSPNCTIWEAARATSAAPTFFKRISIGEGGLKEEFIDGGLGCNNPVKQLLQEAGSQFNRNQHVACIVNIGTGQANTIKLHSPDFFQRLIPTGVVAALKGIATDCESVAEDFSRRFGHVKSPGVYFRLNVEQGLQDIPLNECEKLAEIQQHTVQYLQKSLVSREVDSIVEALRKRPTVIAVAELRV